MKTLLLTENMTILPGKEIVKRKMMNLNLIQLMEITISLVMNTMNLKDIVRLTEITDPLRGNL
jgi:hypothetical protein